MAAFENPKGDGPAHRAVAAAMGRDVADLELYSTDSITLHGPTWAKVLKRRARILATVERLLAIPEEKVDIWEVALTLAEDMDEAFDKKSVNAEFERIVAEARAMANARDDPDYHVRALNTYIFKKLAVEYDKSDYAGQRLASRYAHTVVVTKKGTCANLAYFYIAVAQRLRFPVYAVGAPLHVFARYVDPRLMFQNIDPAGRGGYSSDATYIKDLEIPQVSIENGSFMRTMTHGELAAEMIVEHAVGFYSQTLKDHVTAIMIMDRALAKAPQNSDLWNLMGQIHKNWANQEVEPGLRDLKYTRAFVFIQKAMRMGRGKPIDRGYIKKLQEMPTKRGPGV